MSIFINKNNDSNSVRHCEPIDNNPENNVDSKSSVWDELIALLVRVALMAFVFFFLFGFVFHTFRYNDLSMDPALLSGDLVFSYSFDKNYIPGDVVSFGYEDKRTCGRIVALEGDKVDIDVKGLVVNGSSQYEPRISHETTQVKGGVEFPLVVPKGCVFVLGDNRPQAVDSRILGCLRVDDTDGKLIAVFRRRGI